MSVERVLSTALTSGAGRGTLVALLCRPGRSAPLLSRTHSGLTLGALYLLSQGISALGSQTTVTMGILTVGVKLNEGLNRLVKSPSSGFTVSAGPVCEQVVRSGHSWATRTSWEGCGGGRKRVQGHGRHRHLVPAHLPPFPGLSSPASHSPLCPVSHQQSLREMSKEDAWLLSQRHKQGRDARVLFLALRLVQG